MCGAVNLETSHLLLVCVTTAVQSWVRTLATAVTGVGYRGGSRSGSLRNSLSLFLIAAFLSQKLKVLCHTLKGSYFVCPFLKSCSHFTDIFLNWFDICG